MTESAFPQIGLRAIIDMSNMDSGTMKIMSAISSLNNSIANFAAKSVSGFNAASSSMNSMASMATRVSSIVVGIVVADVFRGITRAVSDMAAQTIDAVSSFQKLKIQMDTIAARNYSREFGIPASEALAKVSGESEVLLRWLREIAVQTPFSVESLASVFALAQAYGFTTSQAQKLVMSVGDFTSAMGLGDDVLKRIIYSMGQMVSAGRPTGREIRELANAFVPVGTIVERLAKDLGKTKNEISSMLESGAIGAKQYIAEFEEMVAEDFPNAMQRMSRTFSAVSSNIGDFFKSLVGYEVLGPVADRISGAIQDTLEAALSPESYRTAGAAGEALLYSYDKIAMLLQLRLGPALAQFFDVLGFGTPTTYSFASALLGVGTAAVFMIRGLSDGLTAVSGFVRSIFEFFGTSMNDLSSKMSSWGANIVLQFARGIASGIQFVIQAVSYVAQVITTMLQAHSPPLILQDLPAWGAAAMTSYMEGWKSGDFSVFEEIQSLVEKAIMSLKVTGKEGNEMSLVEKVIGSSDLIAKAVDQFRRLGQASSDLLSQISSAPGFMSEEFQDFIQKSFDAAKFQGISEAISKALEFKGIGQITIFGTLVDSFQEIRDLAQQFGSELSAALIQYTYDAEKLIEVNEKISATQEEINSVTKKYDDIIKALEKQLQKNEDESEDLTRVKSIDKTLNSKILTADERKRLELEKERILLQRKLRDTKTEKDTELEALRLKLEAYQKEQKALEEKIAKEKELLKSIAEERAKVAKDELEAARKLIEAQIRLNELLSRKIQIEIGGKGAGEAGEEAFDEFLNGVSMGLPKLGEVWGTALDDMWAEMNRTLLEFVIGIEEPFKKLTAPFAEMSENWKNLFNDPTLKTRLEEIGAGFTSAFAPFLKFNDENGQKIAEAFGAFLAGLIANVSLSNTVTGKSFIQIMQESIAAIGDTLVKNGPAITKFIDDFQRFVNEKAIPKFKEFLETLGTKTIPALIDFAVSAAPVILEVLKYLVDHADVVLGVFLALKGLETIGTMVATLTGVVNLLKGIPVIGTVVTTVFTAIAGLSTPMFLLVTALLALGYVLTTFGPDAWVTLERIVALMQTPEGRKGLGDWFGDQVISIGIAANQLKQLPGLLLEAWWKENTKDWIPPATVLSELVVIFRVKLLEFFETVKGTITEGWNKIFSDWGSSFGKDGSVSKSASEFVKGIPKAFEGAFGPEGSLATLFSGFGSRSEDSFTTLFGDKGTLPLAFAGGSVAMGGNWELLFGDKGTLWSTLDNFGSTVGTWWNEKFGTGGGFVSSLSTLKANIGLSWSGIFGPSGSLSSVLDTFGSTIGTAFSGIFGEGGSFDFKSILESFQTEIGKVWSGIVGSDGSIISKIGELSSGLYNSFSSIFERIGDNPIVAAVVNWGAYIANKAWYVGYDLVKGIKDGIYYLWQSLLDLIGTMLSGIPDWIIDWFDGDSSNSTGMRIAGESMMENLASGIESASYAPIRAMQRVVSAVSNPVHFSLASSFPSGSSGAIYNYDQRVEVRVNSAYSHVQSEASVYSDVNAALASIRR